MTTNAKQATEAAAELEGSDRLVLRRTPGGKVTVSDASAARGSRAPGRRLHWNP